MKTAPTSAFAFLSLMAACFFAFQPCSAQELTPRALAPAPVRMHILAFGYAYSYGNYIFNSALPLKDVNTKSHSLVVPLKAPHSGLRLGWVNGLTARFGASFTTFAVAYTYIWGGGL